ncbi:hypothetical protein RIF25_15875 [Thermosynechococcaceae cyanobacterium BACA0444]|uniref:Uncharacterized protein n=1 Tax=Pseudocalidococcus azoricus BACA0444 TaxID=2918990 RepID=A0AAE4FTY3_9CYAN|nr:hypothetical protein [Pseudocalidococcus azoricus]MDS3862278.1 hypothetical protein [Pseudocalidococcus azoricus BACA0444]
MNPKFEPEEVNDMLNEYDFSKARPGRYRGFRGLLIRVLDDGREQTIDLEQNNKSISLSPKQIKLIIEALEYRINANPEQLQKHEVEVTKDSGINSELIALTSLLEKLN